LGLYDRDYMKKKSQKNPSGGKPPNDKTILIIVAAISFILGFILGKII